MDEWGDRQLRTSRLIRICAAHLLRLRINAENVYGLCKLTWITNSFDATNGAYIKSTKIPGLSAAFSTNFLNTSIDRIAVEIVNITGEDAKAVKEVVLRGTGYTNFYKAYRNSAKHWLYDNFDKIKPLISQAYHLESDRQAERIMQVIADLPRIPKGKGATGNMAPEFLLTPLFFSLDPRLRFPLLNGNEGVAKLLKTLKVANRPLVDKFRTVVALIGQGDIKTSIDIDRLQGDLPEFVSFDGTPPRRKKLQAASPTALDLKDEDDIKVIRKNLEATARRLHNRLTNLLVNKLNGYQLHQGNSKENMFDVLVKSFRSNEQDLLIEVKSSAAIADVRMAIGQLMDYSRQLPNCKNTRLAVLLTEAPDGHVRDLLNYLGVICLWAKNDSICTESTEIPDSWKSDHE